VKSGVVLKKIYDFHIYFFFQFSMTSFRAKVSAVGVHHAAFQIRIALSQLNYCKVTIYTIYTMCQLTLFWLHPSSIFYDRTLMHSWFTRTRNVVHWIMLFLKAMCLVNVIRYVNYCNSNVFHATSTCNNTN
jgi:hypothetical protein